MSLSFDQILYEATLYFHNNNNNKIEQNVDDVVRVHKLSYCGTV